MEPHEAKIIEWLASGDDGLSSRTLAYRTLGQRYFMESEPRAPSDLRRCAVLIDKVPEVKASLEELAEEYPGWRVLVVVWDSLVDLLRREIGENLPNESEAPQTYRLMQTLLTTTPNPGPNCRCEAVPTG